MLFKQSYQSSRHFGLRLDRTLMISLDAVRSREPFLGIGKSFIILFILILAVNGASGAEKIYCESIPMQDSDWIEILTFPKFDPGMGTLNSVAIDVDYNISQNIMMENNGS